VLISNSSSPKKSKTIKKSNGGKGSEGKKE
jgi:hypothetical protein